MAQAGMSEQGPAKLPITKNIAAAEGRAAKKWPCPVWVPVCVVFPLMKDT